MAIQDVQLLRPADYPPYESRLDSRIPQHFASTSNVNPCVDPTDPIYITAEDIEEDAKQLFASGGLRGRVSLSTAEYLDLASGKMKVGPKFFAVFAFKEDLQRWHTVHDEIRELIISYYADHDTGIFQDPPIRWFAEIEVWQ